MKSVESVRIIRVKELIFRTTNSQEQEKSSKRKYALTVII